MRLWHLLVMVAVLAVIFGLIRLGPIGWIVLLEVGALGLWKLGPAVTRLADLIEARAREGPVSRRLVAMHVSGLLILLYVAVSGVWFIAAGFALILAALQLLIFGLPEIPFWILAGQA
jgi:hypothetical protein